MFSESCISSRWWDGSLRIAPHCATELPRPSSTSASRSRKTSRRLWMSGQVVASFALVAHRRFPKAALHCFEPVPQARQKLTAVTRDIPAIRVYDLALGSRGGSVEVRVSENLDSSSLLPMTTSHLLAFPGSAETERVTVPVARLDAILTPDLMPPPT